MADGQYFRPFSGTKYLVHDSVDLRAPNYDVRSIRGCRSAAILVSGDNEVAWSVSGKDQQVFDQGVLINKFVDMKMRELRFDGCRRCARVRSGRILARW